MIYVDDTALLEMVRRTAASRALAHVLNRDMTQVVVTSVLSEVEVGWALREDEPTLVTAGQGLLRRVCQHDVDDDVRPTTTAILRRARVVDDRVVDVGVASTDLSTAVHVATALVVLGEQCHGFATAAPHRAAVARAHGLAVLSPSRGRTPPACR